VARRNLAGKRAILTGASSGIGWELAVQLARDNVRLIVCARREERLRDLKAEVESQGGTIEFVAGDITDPSVRKTLVQTCVREFGGVDILINNAGIGAMGRFDAAKPDRIRQIFEVNFFAITDLISEALPELKKGSDSIIVNISSVLGHRAAPLKSEYCASKFALHGFSDAIRAELTKDNIDLLLVSPSTTDSEFFDQAIEDNTKKNWKSRGAMSPDVVAAKSIRAIKKGKHEIILTHGGRFLVWLDRLVPSLANKILARFGQ
jgi:short-subunit dehydrogenase